MKRFIMLVFVILLLSGCTYEGMLAIETEAAEALKNVSVFVEEVGPIVWETLVRQAYVVGIREVLTGIILAVITCGLFRGFKWARKGHQHAKAQDAKRERWSNDEYHDDYQILYSVIAIIGIITATMSLITFFNGLTIRLKTPAPWQMN